MSFITDYLKKYPYFMRKDTQSNNYKHHNVTGKQLLEAKQVLSNLEWDKELTKPVQIYRVQSTDYNYSIHFKINVPIDTVIFRKDNDVITPVEYTTGHYIYTGTSTSIIPDNKFSCTVITTDEEVWSHGIPENDTVEHDIYDHDLSLDQIGDIVGVSRRNFKSVVSSDYSRTVPPFNNLSVESDYDYSQRLLEFCENLQVKPLPLLYLKAWLGVDGELVNRESTLCKMSPGDIYGVLPSGDNPLSWEHRDQLCTGAGVEDYYFSYTVNTRRPLNNTVLGFTFNFLDSYYARQSVEGVVVPYVDGNNNNLGIINNTESWSIVSSSLGSEDYLVRFKYFSSQAEAQTELTSSSGAFVENGLYTDELLFTIVSCSDADVYVSTTGSDVTGTGTSSNPYRTVKYGVSKASINDTVLLTSGTYDEDLIIVADSINLITCGTSSIESDTRDYLSLAPYKSLLVDGVGFVKDDTTSVLSNNVFRNDCNGNVFLVKRTHDPTPGYTGAVCGLAVAGCAVVGTSGDIEEEDI